MCTSKSEHSNGIKGNSKSDNHLETVMDAIIEHDGISKSLKVHRDISLDIKEKITKNPNSEDRDILNKLIGLDEVEKFKTHQNNEML